MEKMNKWENMDDSMWTPAILRYKDEEDALDLVIKGLGGLQTTMRKHTDLKSRSLVEFLTDMLRETAPMRQDLRPVSDFYKEAEKKGEGYVNESAFERERRACERVMVQLKGFLSHTHEHLMVWYVQEFGKLTVLTRTPTGTEC